MNLPLFIAGRYLISGRRSGFASLVSIVSLLGLTLGVIALIVVVSVMNGFDRELKQRILGVVPHTLVAGSSETELESALAEFQPVLITRFQEAQFLLVNGRASQLSTVFGIDTPAESAASILPASMTSGSLAALAPGSEGIVLGASLARRLGLRLDDQVTLILPKTGASGNTVRPRMAVARLVGTFAVGSELDFHLGFMHVDDLVTQTGSAPELRLTLADIFAAPMVSASLRAKGLTVRDWTDRYGDFFQTVRMEKVMMGILLFFVVAVAAFSIVSGLSMLVDSKRRDIAVLRTMGMDEAGIRRLFFSQGLLVTLSGVGLGVLFGVPLAYNVADLMSIVESLVGFSIVEGTYFSQIPTDPRWFDIVVIVVVALGIGMLATLYPSSQAARLAPAEVLSYE